MARIIFMVEYFRVGYIKFTDPEKPGRKRFYSILIRAGDWELFKYDPLSGKIFEMTEKEKLELGKLVETIENINPKYCEFSLNHYEGKERLEKIGENEKGRKIYINEKGELYERIDVEDDMLLVKIGSYNPSPTSSIDREIFAGENDLEFLGIFKIEEKNRYMPVYSFDSNYYAIENSYWPFKGRKKGIRLKGKEGMKPIIEALNAARMSNPNNKKMKDLN